MTEREKELEDAAQFLGQAVNALDEVKSTQALTEDEQRNLEDSFRTVHSMYADVLSRKVLAGTDWEMVEDNLTQIRKICAGLEDELPDSENAGGNDAALLVAREISNISSQAFEARQAAKDIQEYDQ